MATTTTANNKRILAMAQKGFRRDVRAMFTQMAERVGAVVLMSADSDGMVPRSQQSYVQSQTGEVIDSYFLGANDQLLFGSGYLAGRDVRSPYGEDGITPLAEYPRILNKWIAMAQAMMVIAEYNWMRRNIPEDIQLWLSRTPSRDAPVKEMIDELTEEQIEALRLFRPNPLAEYEPAHTWVDPNGYRLSDRIWRTDVVTRSKLDGMVMDAINEGMSAARLAKRLEQFLIPGRAKIRTKKPYGTDASYDAMRLARTEIARAGNQAAFISAYTNPYVDKIDVRRSANGDPTCTVCPKHATIGIGGERLRAPYSIHSANIPAYHPHCMCTTIPVVTDSPETVTRNLRAIIEEAGQGLPLPIRTVLQPQNMLRDLLREPMYREVTEFLAQSIGP